VGRVARISRQYLRHRDALGVRSDASVARDIGRTVQALADADELPAPDDVQGIVPGAGNVPVQTFAFARQVASRNLWVWYQTSVEEVTIVGLTSRLTDL
jgi:hypothetical protein